MTAAPKLLTRTQFREGVFARDSYRCVVREGGVHCASEAKDAHHILERRLWPDGGYYLDNGASVCEPHHLLCERTQIECEELREWCGIKTPVLPPHLYPDQRYDKWGNPILPNGTRMRGELFEDESVQKVIAPVLHLFTNRVKYPRTYHLPWSFGVTDDDRVMAEADVERLLDRRVVVTVKMDGENTTMYRDGIHARSLEYNPHASRDWVKALHARIAHEIPEGWRICGENLYAEHSIHYRHLRSWFQVFSIWDGLRCLSWEETVEYAAMLDLPVVPVIPGDRFSVVDLCKLGGDLTREGYGEDECEGYVVRVADEFSYGGFRQHVGKFVRENHVRTHGHWTRRAVVPNELKGGAA